MDKAEDRGRYIVFATAIHDVVMPLFRQLLRNHLTNQGFTDLQDFLNHQPIRHKLFHLQFKNRHCTHDHSNCFDVAYPPLLDHQWDQLYTGNYWNIWNRKFRDGLWFSSPWTFYDRPSTSCHSFFKAREVSLDDIDLSLASLILIECCSLAPNEVKAVDKLIYFRDKYINDNDERCIMKYEFKNIWKKLVKNILTLDPTRRDKLIRIQQHKQSLADLFKKFRNDQIDQMIVSAQKMIKEILQSFPHSIIAFHSQSPPSGDGSLEEPKFKWLQNFFTGRPSKEVLEKQGIIQDAMFGGDWRIICEIEKAKIPKFVIKCVVAIEKRVPNRMHRYSPYQRQTFFHVSPEKLKEKGIRGVQKTDTGGKGKFWLVDSRTTKVIQAIQIQTDQLHSRFGDQFLSSHLYENHLTYCDQYGEKIMKENSKETMEVLQSIEN